MIIDNGKSYIFCTVQKLWYLWPSKFTVGITACLKMSKLSYKIAVKNKEKFFFFLNSVLSIHIYSLINLEYNEIRYTFLYQEKKKIRI